MRSFSAVLGLFVLLVGVLQTTPAKAETEEGAVMTPRGTLYCEGNRALIYLGRGSLENVISALPEGTETFSNGPVDGNECRLDDGRTVRVKVGTAHRENSDCGARPFTNLSLWIDQKKALSQSFLFDDCYDVYHDIRLIEGNKLFACYSHTVLGRAWGDGYQVEGCQDLSDDIAKAEFDAVEYGFAENQKLPIGKIRISFAEDPAFCARFVSTEPPLTGPLETVREANFLGPIGDPRMFQNAVGQILIEQDCIHAIPEMDDQPIFTQVAQQLDHATWRAIGKLDTDLYIAGYDLENPDPIDFDNDETDDVVLRHAYRSRAGDGDRFYVLPMDEGVAALDLLGTKATAFIGVPGVPANANEGRESYNVTAEMTRIFGETEDPANDYRLQTVFRYQGQTLVFATLFNGYTGAVVYRPRPGGVEEPVCIFERKPEN